MITPPTLDHFLGLSIFMTWHLATTSPHKNERNQINYSLILFLILRAFNYGFYSRIYIIFFYFLCVSKNKESWGIGSIQILIYCKHIRNMNEYFSGVLDLEYFSLISLHVKAPSFNTQRRQQKKGKGSFVVGLFWPPISPRKRKKWILLHFLHDIGIWSNIFGKANNNNL